MADARRSTVLAYGWLFVLAAATRIAAELWVTSRSPGLATASALGIAALAMWAFVFIRNVLRTPG